MSFSKILYPLLNTGSTQEDAKLSRNVLKMLFNKHPRSLGTSWLVKFQYVPCWIKLNKIDLF